MKGDISDLGNLSVARREHNSLPRLLSYLVKSTSTLFVFVDCDAERVLCDVPAWIELAVPDGADHHSTTRTREDPLGLGCQLA